jgi:hypothetical protein
MNRRIPNGTYGGVGGRRLAAFSYPINRLAKNHTTPLLVFVIAIDVRTVGPIGNFRKQASSYGG